MSSGVEALPEARERWTLQSGDIEVAMLMRRLLMLFFLFCVCAGCLEEKTEYEAPFVSNMTVIQPRLLVETDVPLNQSVTANVGEIMMSGTATYLIDVYSPIEDMDVLIPYDVPVNPMPRNVGWGAFFQFEDGSLVIEAPNTFTSKEYRLGLRVTKSGYVLGKYPWYDLNSRSQIPQPSWEGKRRQLFFRGGDFAVNTIAFSEQYNGQGYCNGASGCAGLFEYREGKPSELEKSASSRVIMGDEDMIFLWAHQIDVQSIEKKYVKYVVTRTH